MTIAPWGSAASASAKKSSSVVQRLVDALRARRFDRVARRLRGFANAVSRIDMTTTDATHDVVNLSAGEPALHHVLDRHGDDGQISIEQTLERRARADRHEQRLPDLLAMSPRPSSRRRMERGIRWRRCLAPGGAVAPLAVPPDQPATGQFRPHKVSRRAGPGCLLTQASRPASMPRTGFYSSLQQTVDTAAEKRVSKGRLSPLLPALPPHRITRQVLRLDRRSAPPHDLALRIGQRPPRLDCAGFPCLRRKLDDAGFGVHVAPLLRVAETHCFQIDEEVVERPFVRREGHVYVRPRYNVVAHVVDCHDVCKGDDPGNFQPCFVVIWQSVPSCRRSLFKRFVRRVFHFPRVVPHVPCRYQVRGVPLSSCWVKVRMKPRSAYF